MRRRRRRDRCRKHPPAPGHATPTPTPPPPPASDALLTTIGGYSLVNSLDVQSSWSVPATRDGKYDLIGRLTLTPQNGNPSSYRTVLPGEFTMSTNLYLAVTGDFPSYSLTAPAGILPEGLTSLGPATIVGSWDINSKRRVRSRRPLRKPAASCRSAPDGISIRLRTVAKPSCSQYDFTRGSTSTTTSLGSGNSLSATLDYDIGYSYVAMGEWSWRVVDLNGAAAGDFGDSVVRQRRSHAGIWNSGIRYATYRCALARTLSSSFTAGIPFTLTADFGSTHHRHAHRPGLSL